MYYGSWNYYYLRIFLFLVVQSNNLIYCSPQPQNSLHILLIYNFLFHSYLKTLHLVHVCKMSCHWYRFTTVCVSNTTLHPTNILYIYRERERISQYENYWNLWNVYFFYGKWNEILLQSAFKGMFNFTMSSYCEAKCCRVPFY